MAIIEIAQQSGQTGDQAQTERVWLAYYYATVEDAIAAVGAVAPAMIGDLWLQFLGGTEVGKQTFHVRAHYGKRKPRTPGEVSVGFSVSMEQVRLLQSHATIATHVAPGEQQIDLKGALGPRYDTHGVSIEGIDVPVPVRTLTMRFVRDGAQITESYLASIQRVPAVVNDGLFFGFERGELLWQGLQLRNTIAEQESAELELTFGVRPNRTGIQIGDVLVPSAEGWHVLNILQREQEDNGRIVKRTVQVSVERVFDYYDFTNFLA